MVAMTSSSIMLGGNMVTEFEILKSVISDLFEVDSDMVDNILKENTDIVHIGKVKDSENHIIGHYDGQMVSIEKMGLIKLFNLMKMVME